MLRIKAVVPAAGLARRMGGPNKMLLPLGDSTVIGTVVKTLLECDLEVVVVTGRDHDAVAKAAAPAQTVFNLNFESGLGSSIAAGARACEDCDGILIALGDMPNLSPDVVDKVVRVWTGPACIAAASYAEADREYGHPVLFGSDYIQELSQLDGDRGAFQLLQSNRGQVVSVSVPGSLTGLDRPSDAAG